ncbi:hypothetical protein Q4567_19260 [Aliiglaciecola sp. 2_MG-2023]|uniref:hypothetical protein n=1 Tax=unclassified Aliiglaciecola TaxID=2593648 RepID=UPI0026E21974|nr:MULTISPECIES: hypothetical protein [unclassified Aliiglaciecola]MDO6712881.1 hypothetical protein [Aliiglaciecola sp. 2_MG-2023]MDO6752883.1 hypothetical protein [Aliiglaciecola sp. 1_MG-2023]
MKVLIVANYMLSHQQSMQRFADMIKEGHEVKVIRPDAILCKIGQAEHVLDKCFVYIDRLFLFLWQLKQMAKWADVVHICDHSKAMYNKWINNPSLVTCLDQFNIQSDLGFIETNKTGFTGRRLQKWIVSGLQVSAHVFCIFMKAKDKVWRLFHKQPHDLKPSCFVNLSGNQRYKSRLTVAEIYSPLIQLLKYRICELAGTGKPWFDALKGTCLE